MEVQKPSDAIENPEIPLPFLASPTTDIHDGIDSTSVNSLSLEETRPSLAQRIAEAFREGVASAKPDYVKRPESRIAPAEKKKRQESAGAGILDKAIHEGGSAATAVGDKAAIALDIVVQMAKKAPAVTHRLAQAFREGAASVKPRVGSERTERLPRSGAQPRPASEGKGIFDSLLHPNLSAREILRSAVSVVKPSAARGARRKIRMCKKKIHNLYLEIGCEAAKAWGSGPVETEKVAGLLDEVRKNEEEIQKQLDLIAEMAAAKKPETVREPPAAKAIEFSPADHFVPDPVYEAEAAPMEEIIVITEQVALQEAASEPVREAEAAPPEEGIATADSAPSKEPVAIQEKTLNEDVT